MADTLSNLAKPIGSTQKKIRRGRGVGSGLGKTAGRGQKGQYARSRGFKPHFEGGQTPIQRRMPKRGFNNPFPKITAEINVSQLDMFGAGAKVDEQALRDRGLVKGRCDRIKILGDGDLTKAVTVHRALLLEVRSGEDREGRRQGAPRRREARERLCGRAPPKHHARGLREHRQGAGAASTGDLHRRHARGVPHRRLRLDPRGRPERHAGRGEQAGGRAPRLVQHVQRRRAGERLDLHARHHAVRVARASSSSSSAWSSSRSTSSARRASRAPGRSTSTRATATIVLSLVQGFSYALTIEGLEQR